MNTNRITINEIDLSSVTTETTTSVVGYTVVKAPKGSITPVRISSGGGAKLKDVIGSSSKEYPEIYEAERFIEEYDLYISSPYKEAYVPVAYVTGEGIFPSDTLVQYTTALEEIILNNLDPEMTGEIDGITQVSSGVSILKDMRYPRTSGLKANIDIPDSYPSYNNDDSNAGSFIKINTGLTKTQLKNAFASGVEFVLKNIPALTFSVDGESKSINEIKFKLKTSATGDTNDVDGWVYQSASTGSFKDTDCIVGFLGDKDSIDINSDTSIADQLKAIMPAEPSSEADADATTYSDIEYAENDEIYIYIRGYYNSAAVTEDTGDLITPDYIINNLYLEDTRKSIGAFYKKPITTDDVFGVIFPKYPSNNRELHLSFQSFNKNRGYDPGSVSSRNILKIDAYETGAFHNESHPVSVVGSLLSSATDANGAKLGFTNSNADYTDQDLFAVYTIKPFTDASQIKNTSITKYPDIVLKGGYKKVDGDSVELHNLGWEKAADDEYSVIDLFFDSSRNTSLSINPTNNLFFTLANTHKTAGYIFNFTIGSPNELSVPLTFGSGTIGARYWNICNEAIIQLSNGDKIITPITGVRASMQARIIEGRWGGIAPMYTNSSSMGGQLNISPIRLVHKYNKDTQDKLVDLNLNPVIYDHTYGVMLVGQMTCKAGDLTDWSYIGHASSFLNIEKQIRDQVMIPQLGKANNPYYRALRKQQVDNLLAKRLNGDNRIWRAAYCDTSTADGVNDAAAQRAKKFVINVGIQPDSFSEYIILNLTNFSSEANLFEISEYAIGSEE